MGFPNMRLRVGDAVRVRPNPEVDETLWDEQGFVLDIGEENRVFVELGSGEDCAFNPDQLDIVAPMEARGGPDAVDPFNLF